VDPTIIMSLLASTIASVPPSPHKPWNSRILLGVWGTKYLPLAKRHLPAFSVTNIGFSTIYARSFFRHAYVGFNILATIVTLWPIGPRFIRSAHARNRSVIVWTVNDERVMRWAMEHKVDGIITDNPKRLVEVMEEWTAGKREFSLSWRQKGKALWFNCIALFFVVLLLQWRAVDRFDGGRRKNSSWRYKQLSGATDARAPKLT
jgi:Glycerophosphoryl diester phosphodiesterase family